MIPPRKKSWARKIARMLPPVVLNQPWAIFIKSLCIFSGFSTFLGPPPGSIESVLPGPIVYLWASTLIAGASAALFGLLRPAHRRIELAGLIWLGTAAIVYAVTLTTRAAAGGAVPGGIVLGFGLAALVRALAVYVSYEIVRRVTD
jgi:hypothetical protein